MNPATLILIFLVVLLVPILMGIPVAYAIGISSLVIMLLPFVEPSLNLSIIPIRMMYSSDFILLAIPFYLFAGRLLANGGATDAIFEFTQAVVGPIRGGVAHVNVIASLIFSGMSGSAVADAAGLGTVEYDMMTKAGYDDGFSTAVIGSSAIIGPVFPPSIPFILYGVLAEESIGDLFLAGIIPGFLLSFSLMAMIAYYAITEDHPTVGAWQIRRIVSTFIYSLPALLVIVLIIGGILSGLFTATEAGAVAVVWAVLIGVFVYREVTFSVLWQTARETVMDVGALLLILATAYAYAYVIGVAGIPDAAASALISLGAGPTVTLFAIVIILLFLGAVLGPVTNLILIVPILAPQFGTLGIDPIHAGVVIVLTLMFGLLTPPVGAVLYVLERVTDVSLERIISNIIPFYLPLLAALALLVIFPSLSTYIPYTF